MDHFSPRCMPASVLCLHIICAALFLQSAECHLEDLPFLAVQSHDVHLNCTESAWVSESYPTGRKKQKVSNSSCIHDLLLRFNQPTSSVKILTPCFMMSLAWFATSMTTARASGRRRNDALVIQSSWHWYSVKHRYNTALPHHAKIQGPDGPATAFRSTSHRSQSLWFMV